MANYNFKKQAEVYLVYGGSTTRLDVTEDISFSQTFTDKTYAQRTLHEQHKLHEASSITKANPANFSFTIPALTQSDLDVVFNLLVDFKSGEYTLNTFDLYIRFPNDVYKLEKCVITNGTFVIEKLENLKLNIEGEASQLTRGASISSISRGTRTSQRIDYLYVVVDSVLLQDINSISVELQNDIKWLPYETVNDALDIGNTHNIATTMYPSSFTLNKRTLSGSISQYVSDSFNSVQTWKIGIPIVIKAGESATQGFQFNLSNCSFTNRNNVGEVFTQNYDWKMNDNPTDLGSKIKFNNI